MRASTLLFATTVLAGGSISLSAVQAQTKREITAKVDSREYLFFLNDSYRLNARVSKEDAITATESQLQVQTVGVDLKAAPAGICEIPQMKLECQGVTYVVPDHRITVLGERPKEAGFFIQTAPDPNGSGNVELLVGWNGEERPSGDIQRDYSTRPSGIEVVRSPTSSSSSDTGYRWLMMLVLRNTTDTPYTLRPEFFKNLPPIKEWPKIIIPPAELRE